MTPDERDQTIAAMLPHARAVAYTVNRQYGGDLNTLDDCMSDAYLGTIHAVDNYDPARGTPLAQHVMWKARNAIIDGYRQRSELPRDRNGRTMHSIDEMRERCADHLANGNSHAINDRGLELEAADEPGYDGVENRAVQCWLFRLARHVLSPHQYWTVEQYYLHGRLLADIGRERGVTDSCVCQTLATAHRKLRAAINERP